MSKNILPIIAFCFFSILTNSLYSEAGPGEGISDDGTTEIKSR